MDLVGSRNSRQIFYPRARENRRERNRIKAAGTKTACTGRKFAENWKIINCQTTLKKLAWSAPGCSLAGIFSFFFFFFFFFHQSPRKLPFSLILINLVKKFPATPAGSSLLLPPLFPPVPLFLPLSPSFFPSLFFLNCVSKKKEGKENILIPRRYWQWQI